MNLRCYGWLPAAVLIPFVASAMPFHEDTYNRLRAELGPGAEIVVDFDVPTSSARNTGKTQLQSAMMPDLVTGTKHPCVACIQYPDYAKTYTRDNFQNMLFGTWSSGSASDYYSEVSFDSISLAGTVFPDSTSWYTADNNRAYYGYSQGSVRAAELSKELAQKADANINYADFDDNDDGEVDMYTVIHSGYGREETGDGNDIHSHSWSFTGAGIGAYTSADPWPGHPGQYITVDAYTIDPERSSYTNNGTMVCIGVFCHEWGHAFGLPDLYSTTGEGNGLGNWSLMASGSWGGDGSSPWKPAHLDAWCKSDLGWLEFRNIDHNGIRDVYAAEDSAVAYRVWTEGSSSSEFFLVENRQKIGFDTTLANSGLLIYHLDTTLIHDRRNNNDIQQYPIYGIDLEDADGFNEIYNDVNRGDGGDPFPGDSANTAFDSLGTNPDSRDNANANTQCGVNDISSSAMTMTAFFYISSEFQPDNLIKNEADADYEGDDIYEEVPGDSQTVEQTKAPQVTAIYHIKITNDGVIPETYLVTGPGDTTTADASWTVSYHDAYTGGNDITAAVTGAGWSTDHIDPDDSVRIRVEVTPQAGSLTDEFLEVVIKSSTSGYSEDKLDAVQAVTTVGESYQPDVQIKNPPDAAYTGDGIYNTTGADQTAEQDTHAGESAVYHVKIENDAADPDTITVQGTAGNALWSVSYFDALSAGIDITAAVTGSGWSTGELAAGGSTEIRVEVTPDTDLPQGYSFEVEVTAISVMVPSSEDVVKAVTTVQEGPAVHESIIQEYSFSVQDNVISFSLPISTTVNLSVYDAAGRSVAVLAQGPMTAGCHNLECNLLPGVYFVKFAAPEYAVIRKIVVLD